MKLKKPARIGATIFGVGVDERLVIERAQREYEYRRADPTEPTRADTNWLMSKLRRLK